MAQGSYYTRQQQNQLQQGRIRRKEEEEARKKAEEQAYLASPEYQEKLKYDASRERLSGLITDYNQKITAAKEREAAERAAYAAYLEERRNMDTSNLTASQRYSISQATRRKRDAYKRSIKNAVRIQRKYQEDLRTAQKAYNSNTTLSAQKTSEARARSTQAREDRERDAIIGKFGEEVGAEILKNPEARRTAYDQLTNPDFKPTPNRAAQKDAYNRAQEEDVRARRAGNLRIDQINANTQATYDEVNANWLDATAGEYFDFVKTGVDRRNRPSFESVLYGAVTDNRQREFSRITYEQGKTDTFLYNNIVTPYRKANTAIRDAFRDAGIGGTQEQLRNPEPNALLVKVLGKEREEAFRTNPVRQNFAAWLGRNTADRPIGLTGDLILTATGAKAISYASGAGYTFGSFGGSGLLAKSGGLIGATALGGGVLFTGVESYGYVSSLPLRQDVAAAGIPYPAFQKAVTEGYQTGGFTGELFTGFGNKERFVLGYQASLESQGFSSFGTSNLALDARDVAIRKEGAYLFGAGSVANIIGARTTAASVAAYGVPKSFASNFARGFVDIGIAGVSEGTLSSFGQNLARGENLQYGRAAFSGAVGFVSAGTLGGLIQGNYYAPNPKTRRWFELAGYVLDPTEVGSDYLTGIGGSPYGAFYRGIGGDNVVVASYPFPLFNEGRRPLAPARTNPFITSNPFPPPPPRQRGVFSEPVPFIEPNPKNDPFPFINPDPRTNPNPRSNPNPLVDVPVNPIVDVPVNPNVPVNPIVDVPVSPNPIVDVPVNPLVDVPVSSKFPFFFGSGKRLSRGRKRGFGSGFTKASYTPSFAALELGIGASKIKGNRTFSGLEIRPFLAPERKKKKKGKRTKGKKRRNTAPLFSLGLGRSPI